MTSITPPTLLVCTLDRSSCHRLLKAGREIAAAQELDLQVLSIQPEGLVSPAVAEEIQILHNISSGAGAAITILFSDRPALTAAVFAKQQEAAILLLDRGDLTGIPMPETVRELAPEMALYILEPDGRLVTFPARQTAPAG